MYSSQITDKAVPTAATSSTSQHARKTETTSGLNAKKSYRCFFMELPIELRHKIYGFASQRPSGPEKVIQCWYEIAEMKEREARGDRPDLTPGQYAVAGESEEEGDHEEPTEEDEDEDEDEDDEDEAADDGEEHNEDEDEIWIHNVETIDNAQIVNSYNAFSAGGFAASTTTGGQIFAGAHSQGETNQDAIVSIAEMNGNTSENEDAELQMVDEVDEEDMGDSENIASDEESDEESDDGTATVVAEDNNNHGTTRPPQPASLRSKYHPASKWRHIPQIIQLTHCPPPQSLLLLNWQIHDEVKDFFYNVTKLHIDATASFEHLTYFQEEVFERLRDSIFSPLEQIRYVEVDFVWDSKFIANMEGFSPDHWESILQMRAEVIKEVLSRAPSLQKVRVLWHDSEADAAALLLKESVLNTLYEILDQKSYVMFEIEEKVEQDSSNVNEHSIMGNKRKEFQAIVDRGCNFT
jgi:hypothetical protein